MTEEVLRCGASQSLVGVLTLPAACAVEDDLPAVIIINAGLLHRVGPNRIYVKIARALAEMGFPVLRLDLSGIGESAARTGGLSVEESVYADVRDAMDTLEATRGARHFVMMGHCSGAVFSLLIARRETRVVGAVMINPEVIDETWTEFDQQLKAANYYANFYGRGAVANRERWLRFLTGRADYGTIANNVFRYVIWNRLSATFFRVRTKLGWRAPEVASIDSTDRERAREELRLVAQRGVQLNFIFTEGSTGYTYLRTLVGEELDRLCAAGAAEMTILRQADHIFNLLESQERLVEVIRGAARNLLPQPEPIP